MAVVSSPMQVALYNARKKRRSRTAKIQATGLEVEATSVGSIAATLSMVPQVGRTRYELVDDAGGFFSVSGTTIVLDEAVDAGTYDIVVKAVDPSGNTFTKTITITAVGS